MLFCAFIISLLCQNEHIESHNAGTEDRKKLKDTLIVTTWLNEYWHPVHEFADMLEEEETRTCQKYASGAPAKFATTFFLPICRCQVEVQDNDSDVEIIEID